jgi:hypothetical protein
VNREVASLVNQLTRAEHLPAELQGRQLDAAELKAAIAASRAEEGFSGPVRLSNEKSHLDPVTVTLIVAFAPSINRVAQDVWTYFILPQLRARFGNDAFERIVPPDQK